MTVALLLMRVTLASVFGVAGAAKVVDREGSRNALEAFGVPRQLAVLAPALALGEIALAAALLAARTARVGAVGAGALAAVFALAVAVNLLLGRRPECHCFGRLSSGAIGWSTVARNAIVGSIASVVALAGPGMPVATLTNALGVGGATALAVGIASAWFALHLMRQHGRLLLRIDALEHALAVGKAPSAAPAKPAQPRGLPIGSRVEFRLPDLDGNEISNDDFVGRKLFLVHWSPQCGFCDKIAADLSELQRPLAKRKTDVVLVSYGDAETNRAVAEEYGLSAPILLTERSIAPFESLGTPVAYLIDEEGNVAAPLAVGATEVPELARAAARAPKRAAAELKPLAIGEPAPRFELPTVDGGSFSLAEAFGRPTLVVFTDPQCSACDATLEELAGFEWGRPDTPTLVVVARGDASANDAKAVPLGDGRHHVLQGRKWSVNEAYGTYTTPSAVAVDAEGRIASEPALGVAAITQLASAICTRVRVAA